MNEEAAIPPPIRQISLEWWCSLEIAGRPGVGLQDEKELLLGGMRVLLDRAGTSARNSAFAASLSSQMTVRYQKSC
jgi:hypothetical protein